MAWNAPVTWIGGQVPTAALLNSQLRDNLLETMPAKAVEEGFYFAGTGPNSIAARQPAGARVAASQTTSSTTFTNLSTVGPSVTVTHGDFCIIFHSCGLSNNTADVESYMSWDISGDNVRTAQESTVVKQNGVPANNTWRMGSVDILTTLTPGTSTFTGKYRVSSGTATFSDRFIGVIPL